MISIKLFIALNFNKQCYGKISLTCITVPRQWIKDNANILVLVQPHLCINQSSSNIFIENVFDHGLLSIFIWNVSEKKII